MPRAYSAGFGGEQHMGVDNHVLKGKADSLLTEASIES